jgi:hypothetical protein
MIALWGRRPGRRIERWGSAGRAPSPWAGGAAAGGAVRHGWAPTVLMVMGTLAIALTSYSLSLKVASERRAVERLERGNRQLAEQVKALEAELRVRMRLPQLQRWNDEVLGMVPISATQYVTDPLLLAAYGKPLPGEAPQVQLAVRDVAPGAAPAPAPRLVEVAAEVPAAGPAAPPPAPAVARPLPRPAPEPDTAELLRQVELAFEPGPER